MENNMRIVKKHDERRTEILDVAQMLFFKKGYAQCSINEILKEVNIAKGTFYHYFKSKEEVVDAIVIRFTDTIVSRAEEILKSDQEPLIKLIMTFKAMNMKDEKSEEELESLHKPENALLHQKIMSEAVKSITPILEAIIKEGIEKKVWNCRYPKEYMQIFLSSALVLTDDGILEQDEESNMRIMMALISVLEKMLEVPENSFLSIFSSELN